MFENEKDQSQRVELKKDQTFTFLHHSDKSMDQNETAQASKKVLEDCIKIYVDQS